MNISSNALTDYLRQEIAKGPGISFAHFMEAALYYPHGGYYTSEHFTLGKSGDFITAPELTPLFAACFSQQFISLFEYLGNANILELGAGSGRFAKDLLMQLQRFHALPDHYFIYEISASLRNKQQQFLKQHCPDFYSRIIWLDTLPTQFEGIIFANEVLDALPVHRFHVGQSIQECGVTWENKQFAWKLLTPTHPAFIEKVSALQERYEFSLGYQSEIHLHLEKYVKSITQALTKGMILFVDYGYGEREYYHPERRQGTLTCFYQHQHHANPFFAPGLQDITAHVNFTQVAETSVENNCNIHFTTQNAFLLEMGLMDRVTEAEKGLSSKEMFQLHQAVKTLTMPTEMGERIKLLAAIKNLDLSLPGFCLQDRRRDL